MVNATENDVFNRRYELLLCGTLDIEVCYFLEIANLNIGYYRLGHCDVTYAPLIFFDCEWICTVFLFGIFAVRSLYPKTPSSLASFKSRLVLPFWYRLIQVAMEKRLLTVCSSSHWQQVHNITQ